MKRLLTLLLLAPCLVSAEVYDRAHSSTGNVIGPICAREDTGVNFGAVDYNTTSLTITATATANGVRSTFTYTGGDIDDYDGTPPAWGNPAASAVEVEADSLGCLYLHLRDEVFSVSGATELSIRITDSTQNDIAAWQAQVLFREYASDVVTALNASPVAVSEVEGGINTSAGTITTLDALDTAQDSQHSTTQGAITTVDGNVDAIKAKTDDLTFTNTGEVDANVKSMNDAEVCGNGDSTAWTGDCP